MDVDPGGRTPIFYIRSLPLSAELLLSGEGSLDPLARRRDVVRAIAAGARRFPSPSSSVGASSLSLRLRRPFQPI